MVKGMRCGLQSNSAAAPATVGGKRHANSHCVGDVGRRRGAIDPRARRPAVQDQHALPGGVPRRLNKRALALRRRSPSGMPDEPSPRQSALRRVGGGQVSACNTSDTIPVGTRIYVCVTCRHESDTADLRAGARLLADLERECAGHPNLDVVAVECLSVCKRPCTVSFAAPEKWTYVYGDLPPDTSASAIRHAAMLYADAADGLIPWKLRPDAIKKGVVARIPPLPAQPTKA